MSLYTPEELVLNFKEFGSFCSYIADLFVREIQCLANNKMMNEASSAVYSFLSPKPDSRGWLILKTIVFLVNRLAI